MEIEVKGKGLMPKIKARAKTAVKGGLYVFKGNFLSTVVLVIASITIAKMLGPSGYGLYSGLCVY